MKRNSKSQIRWLAALRGLAVIGVLLTHFLPAIGASYGLNSGFIQFITVGGVDIGKIGVALLFLLAGYLAPASGRSRSKLQFLVNRAFRLYPVYWISIMLVGVIFAFDGHSLSTILANLTMLQTFLLKDDLIGVFWTLPIELLVYVGVLVFGNMMWDKNKFFVIYSGTLVVCVLLGIARKYVYSSTPVAIGLLLGIALFGQLFRLQTEGKIRGKELQIAGAGFVITLLVTSILAYNTDNGFKETWYRYFNSYSLAIAMFIGFKHFNLHSIFLEHIAEICYPVYLFQEIVFRVCFKYIAGWNIIAFCGVALGALYVLSVAAHKYIETPCISLGRDIEKRIGSKKTYKEV